MAPSSSHSQISGFALRTILEKDKLNDTNFTNWYRNLRIVLKQEKKDHVLDNPLPDEPNENATVAATNAYRRAKDESTDISCLMLAHMEPDLQKQFEHVEAYDMIESLKSMFQAQAKTERYQVSQALLSCKLKDGDPLSPHVIKMVGYVQSTLFLVHMGSSFRTTTCMVWIRSSLNCMGCSSRQRRISRRAPVKC